MQKVKVWKEKVIIPTYEIGAPNLEPQFLNNRVYQGSSGAVYPHHVIDKIFDKKINKEYNVIYLENKYLKIMVMPELGGRIQEAFDKVGKRHFIYKNDVIKPALVGLAGPWISGGIEFNWPQHHRPSTFDKIDSEIKYNKDGSASIIVGETEKMYRTRNFLKISLYPETSYIEIKGKLYNGTDIPQNFLWWSNPAIETEGDHESIFPPDVTAVYDHGKRDVISFPVAKGTYYKMDYSKGVDISKYKNIPVPTSYMAYKSKFDFVGAYLHKKQAGVLHVADHNIAPGKKQWTWGNGDFGKAWDRNLTDDNGSYIELMTGVYCDNQPDFSWLEPYEEKDFVQYFMPYRNLKRIKNANKNILLDCNFLENEISFQIASTKHFKDLTINFYSNDVFIKKLFIKEISPENNFSENIKFTFNENEKIKVLIKNSNNNVLLQYKEEEFEEVVPEANKAPKNPSEVEYVEQLILDGEFIEQYKYATADALEYYKEAIKRDPYNTSANLHLSKYFYRKGNFKKSLYYSEKGLERLIAKTQNPWNGELFYLKGLSLKKLGKLEESYNSFYKATWNGSISSQSYTEISILSFKKHDYEKALEFANLAIKKNTSNSKAYMLKIVALRKLGNINESKKIISSILENDPLNTSVIFENLFIDKNYKIINGLNRDINILESMKFYIDIEQYSDAKRIFSYSHEDRDPLIDIYLSYINIHLNEPESSKKIIDELNKKALKPIFANDIFDIHILETIINYYECNLSMYLLGNLFYDKLEYKKAAYFWERAVENNSKNYIVYRNLAIYYYNILNDKSRAEDFMLKAFKLSNYNPRIFFEYSDLQSKLLYPLNKRLVFFEKYKDKIFKRDDLIIEYVKLLNMDKQYNKSKEIISSYNFHPWEGGEGKITTEYIINNIAVAIEEKLKGNHKKAIELLDSNLKYPDNLGEGKLIISTDNDSYFWKGIFDKENSKTFFNKATKGLGEIGSPLYYNDQPSEYVFYQAISNKMLGNKERWLELSEKLISYGDKNIDKNIKIDFFAVSLPDTLVFKNNIDTLNKANCLYVKALGHLAKGDIKNSKILIEEAITINPNHNKSYLFKNIIIPYFDNSSFFK